MVGTYHSNVISSNHSPTGPEYGTTEAAWKGILTEADRLSDLHLKVKDNLCTDVMHQIKVWQKDNYHKVRVLPTPLIQLTNV